VTRIVVLPADETACGLYRLRYPAGVVREVRPDWKIEVYRPSDVQLGRDARGRLAVLYGIPEPHSIDLLVMQRLDKAVLVQFVQWAQENGIAVVVDSDDAMWTIDPENAAYGSWNRKDGATHWRHLDRAMELADLVTVTTPTLERRYGKHGRCEVLPNYVPMDALETPNIRSEFDPVLTIGWAGSTLTHPGDLTVVGDAVRRVVAEWNVRVRVVGDALGAARNWGLSTVEKVGPTEPGEPYYTALTSIDIALVPLRDHTFNRGKSWLKALEFSAVGVPVIASPNPANAALQHAGVPLRLAETPSDWYHHLTDLIAPGRRADIGAALRADTAREARRQIGLWWTYEAHAEEWAEAWERAMARRRALAVR
jgi:glycosyltransferase involved in cell wall biosynthesis